MMAQKGLMHSSPTCGHQLLPNCNSFGWRRRHFSAIRAASGAGGGSGGGYSPRATTESGGSGRPNSWQRFCIAVSPKKKFHRASTLTLRDRTMLTLRQIQMAGRGAGAGATGQGSVGWSCMAAGYCTDAHVCHHTGEATACMHACRMVRASAISALHGVTFPRAAGAERGEADTAVHLQPPAAEAATA